MRCQFRHHLFHFVSDRKANRGTETWIPSFMTMRPIRVPSAIERPIEELKRLRGLRAEPLHVGASAIERPIEELKQVKWRRRVEATHGESAIERPIEELKPRRPAPQRARRTDCVSDRK